MKFYCTKYWATEGIIEFEGEVFSEKYASESDSGPRTYKLFLVIGKDAFSDLPLAHSNVEHKAHLNLHSKERALKKAKDLLAKAAARQFKVVPR